MPYEVKPELCVATEKRGEFVRAICPYCKMINSLHWSEQKDLDKFCRHIWKASFELFIFLDDKTIDTDPPRERQIARTFTDFGSSFNWEKYKLERGED